MPKIVVLGASGMLGHKICQQLAGHNLVGVVRQPAEKLAQYTPVFEGVRLLGGVDVLENRALERALRAERPDFVVNCVGLVKQLEAADDAYLAVAINSLLPHRLERLCRQLGGRLIHISTDCVFDGERGAYRETDPPNARDLYGRSKALGETEGRESAAITLRTSFIGRELKAPWHGLVEWFLSQAGGAVDGYSRVIYSGLTSLELADVVARIVDAGEGLTGVYQVASEPINKYDLLRLVRQHFQVDVEIRPVDEPVSDRSLVMKAFTEQTGYTAPSWSEMIRRMSEDPTPYESWRQ